MTSDIEKAREEWSASMAKRAIELDGERMGDKEWKEWMTKWRELNGFPDPETYLTPCLDPENWIKKAQRTTRIEDGMADIVHRCCYCDHIVKPIIDNERNHDSMTMDHVVPRSQGGPNHHNNRVIACFSCDTVKADGDAVEFAEAVKEYGRPGDDWRKRGAIRRWRKLTGYKTPKRTT